ncbi:hypothetical protein DXV75_01780 [Alteromonas aestuariivivens]|uniref:Nucleotidyltransferase family protein n=1 Tax=Alteromonas aestuariivivens TaxID=1938339 RepID=A0A3D8MFD4_9ALTE|nr:nucleotidyltransferase family protein [Alteromonas aestuariivivens]RDV29214.1 hypothetical protein DXV75_01780 [Alteromonas aestuariivivens]
MKSEARALFDWLLTPRQALEWQPQEWERALRILRANDMLATFAGLFEPGDLEQLSEYARRHLHSAVTYYQRQKHQVHHEVELLHELMAGAGCHPVFLKGAGYVLAEDSNHRGRLMSDIDVMVDKSELRRAELALLNSGWKAKEVTDYDDRYYRQWSHELPPFVHPERGTTLDLHHTVLPPITGRRIETVTLFDNTVQTDSGYTIFNLKFRLLHCIIHLFFNEDYEKACRDVWDIHCLAEQFSQPELMEFIALSQQLGFGTEVCFALRLRQYLLGTEYCDQASETLNRQLRGREWMVKRVIAPAVMPTHPLVDTFGTRIAKSLMYLRGHWVKMPLRILLPHAATKSYRALVSSVMGKYHYES